MSRLDYLRSVLPELLILWVSSSCTCLASYHGFYIGEAGSSPAGPVLCLALLLVLYVVAADRRRWLPGALGYLALCGAVVGACVALSTGDAAAQVDQEGSLLYFALVTVVVPTACFLLTRGLAGCLAWFAVTACACALLQAMYSYDEYLVSILASCSALAMLVARNSAKGRLSASQAAGSSPAADAVTAVAAVAASAAAGLLVWFAVLSPLGLPTVDAKVFTEYLRQPIEFVKGVADINPVYDTSRQSEDLVDGERTEVDDLYVDDSASDVIDARTLRDQTPPSSEQSPEDQSQGESAGQSRSYDNDSLDEDFDLISWSELLPWVFVWIALAVLLAAAVVAYFVWRRRRRRSRLAWLLDAPPCEQVGGLYLFCMGRLGRLGFKIQPGQTPGEWSAGTARAMDVICTETGVSFQECTSIYSECCSYGMREPSEDDIAKLAAFYEGLWRGARRHLGPIRYFFKSFFL